MSQSDEENPADKPFEPTPHKLREARRKGDGPKSTDLTTGMAYLGLAIGAATIGGPVTVELLGRLTSLIDDPASLADVAFASAGAGRPFGWTFVWWSLALMTALVGLPVIFALLSLVMQNALVFAPEKLQPKANRVSPVATMKQKFGPKGLFEFAKSTTKLLCMGALLGVYAAHNSDRIAAMSASAPRLAAMALLDEALRFFAIACVLLLVIGAVDFVWQYARFLTQNRMSKTELADEMKSQEGDPALKQKRRQIGHELATNRMMGDVPKADVVIVNPTHYAVALSWDGSTASAPTVLAKGTDEIAVRIRQIAREHEIPIWRDAPTARSLHAMVEVGDQIAPALYGAVAAAIRYAEEVRVSAGRRSRYGDAP